jgi:hypothetical protein
MAKAQTAATKMEFMRLLDKHFSIGDGKYKTPQQMLDDGSYDAFNREAITAADSRQISELFQLWLKNRTDLRTNQADIDQKIAGAEGTKAETAGKTLELLALMHLDNEHLEWLLANGQFDKAVRALIAKGKPDGTSYNSSELASINAASQAIMNNYLTSQTLPYKIAQQQAEAEMSIMQNAVMKATYPIVMGALAAMQGGPNMRTLTSFWGPSAGGPDPQPEIDAALHKAGNASTAASAPGLGGSMPSGGDLLNFGTTPHTPGDFGPLKTAVQKTLGVDIPDRVLKSADAGPTAGDAPVLRVS